jgi:hypothetical protein
MTQTMLSNSYNQSTTQNTNENREQAEDKSRGLKDPPKPISVTPDARFLCPES